MLTQRNEITVQLHSFIQVKKMSWVLMIIVHKGPSIISLLNTMHLLYNKELIVVQI